MDDKLYYEKRNVTTAAEVKETYDYAVENNLKYYRAITGNGVYFGWVDGRHSRASAGQEWFENPLYKETPIGEVLIEETVTKPLVERIEQPTAASAEVVGEIPAEKDYKALYEEKAIELEQCRTEYAQVKSELTALKTAIFTLVKEVKEAEDILKG